MKLLLLNPPSPRPVNRRFRCTYRARHFLFPPTELLTLGGVASRVPGVETKLLDAVASGLDLAGVAQRAREYGPDLTIALFGHDTFDLDVEAGRHLRGLLDAPLLATGHLPTCFPAAVLALGAADGVLLGEPEPALASLLSTAGGSGPVAAGHRPPVRGSGSTGPESALLAGLFGSLPGFGVEGSGVAGPLPDLDELPAPAYDLLALEPYGDFLLPRPFATLAGSRGCPFGCAYCVRPHGRVLRTRSVERLLDDVETLVTRHGVRTVRFEDDLFTFDADRVEVLCEGIRTRFPGLSWSCVTRSDTLAPHLASPMARAGCRRVYLGIETGSPGLGHALGRGAARDPRPAVLALASAGIEAAGFFLVGHPSESEEDFALTVELARSLPLDWIVSSTVRPYPGTPMFAEPPAQVDFSLSPFRSRFAAASVRGRARARERRLYREFYLGRRFLGRLAMRAFGAPGPTLRLLAGVAWSVVQDTVSGRLVREDFI